jgi:hypothetical protein
MTTICKILGHKYVYSDSVGLGIREYHRTDFCIRCGEPVDSVTQKEIQLDTIPYEERMDSGVKIK